MIGFLLSGATGIFTAAILIWASSLFAHRRAEKKYSQLRRMPVVGFTLADWWERRKCGVKTPGFAPSPHRKLANKWLLGALLNALMGFAAWFTEQEVFAGAGIHTAYLHAGSYAFFVLSALSGAAGFFLLIRELMAEQNANHLYRVLAEPSRDPETGKEVPTSEENKELAQKLAELMTGKRPPRRY